MSKYSAINRINLESFNNTLFDIVVIGGGINGCGIARDASERGLKVLLLEKNDFGSGTSSRATRIKHGGLRYLEYLEFDLVSESLRERELLLKNASHLVKPLKFSIPIYKSDSRKPFYIASGMILYDLLSIYKSIPSYKMLSKSEFVKDEPCLDSVNLLGAAIYYDAQCAFPERICIENAVMAKNAGATVLNHSEAIEFETAEDKIISLKAFDNLSGEYFSVKSKIFVNASGPWVDNVCNLIKNKNIKRKIGGTKGSHIVVKRNLKGPNSAIYVSASDGRPFFIIPWNNYCLIGTTDLDFNGNIDSVRAEAGEVNYLITEANRIISSYQILKEDIIYTYSGVRPLPYLPDTPAAKKTRKHIIFDHSSEGVKNLISVIGGKLTTYRNLSEEVVNYIVKKTKIKSNKCKTRSVPLMGSMAEKKSNFVSILKAKYPINISDSTLNLLIDLYGSQAAKIMDIILDNPDLLSVLSPYTFDIKAQVLYAVENEMALTIEDILLRRTTLGLSESFGLDSLTYIKSILKQKYNYSDEVLEKQYSDYYDLISKRKL